MDKPKYDLSNPGGQPKDWLQQMKEREAQSSWRDLWVPAAFIGLPLLFLASIALLIYGLLK